MWTCSHVDYIYATQFAPSNPSVADYITQFLTTNPNTRCELSLSEETGESWKNPQLWQNVDKQWRSKDFSEGEAIVTTQL